MKTDYLSESRFSMDKHHVYIGATKKYYRLCDVSSEHVNDFEFESGNSLENVSKVLGGSRNEK